MELLLARLLLRNYWAGAHQYDLAYCNGNYHIFLGWMVILLTGITLVEKLIT